MAASLPRGTSPQLKTPYDAIALATHAAMLGVDFRLVGLGEEHQISATSEFTHPQPLPNEWNAQAPSYAFRYKHVQSSMEYLLKVNRMGNKAVVMAMALGDDKTTSFDLRVVDYISASSLPATPVTETTSADDAARTLTNIYISAGRLSDLGAAMRLNIVQKLAPSLQKPGYEDNSGLTRATSHEDRTRPRGSTDPTSPPRRTDESSRQPRYPLQDPLVQPRRPHPTGDFPPPGFEDEYDMTRPPRGMPGMPGSGGGGFGNIGHRDLYPQGLGPNDPFGGMGPGLGGFGGGGMHPTFDDPLFAGRGRGGAGYDPSAPPGSRYDPVGPGGAPRGSGGGGFPGSGSGMGGRPHNPFGGFGGGDFI